MNHEEEEVNQVFVYGTLRRNGGRPVETAFGGEYIGSCVTSGTLYSLSDRFPALVRGEDGDVTGEVYRIGKGILERLDAYEGYPTFYQRTCINTPHGPTWVYHMEKKPSHGAIRIPSGNWITYIEEVRR